MFTARFLVRKATRQTKITDFDTLASEMGIADALEEIWACS